MKRSVRPLYSILLLIVFAAAILTCWTSLRRGFNSFQLESDAFIKQPPPPPPPPPPPVPVVFNTTLIKFAEVEIGEAKSKQEIEQLLEGNFDSQGRYRTFSSWRRFNTHDEYRPTRSSASGRLPVSLRSPKFYRYWLEFRKVLHNWSRNKRFYSEIMSEMIALVKNPIDSYINNSTTAIGYSNGKRYSSCAVVGNSGILLKGEYGDLIDGHEFVIRLNNARVGSFEHNVGSKTSISFINSNILHLCARRPSCFCHPYGANVPMIMYICQPVHFLDYTLCNSTHKAPLLVTDPRLDVLCARIVKYYSVKRFVEETGKPIEKWGSAHDGSMFHYSSGMQAVMLALGICDKVSIFGFGKSVEAKHHYHTNQKAELRLHDYEAEYAFYHDLVERPQVIPFISSKFKIPLVIIYH